MGIQLKNNASGTLATAISASDTGAVLQTGNGASFPALGATDYFYATLESTGGTFEVIKVTVRSGDSMTVVRAQEGSTANSFAAGSRIELRVTAQSVIEAIGDVAASQVGYTPYSWIAATNVQAALDEVATDISAVDGVSGSNLVGYLPAGTGAATTTVQTKLRETVSVKDFGAVADYDPSTSTGTSNFTFFGDTESATAGAFQIPTGNYRNGGTGGVTRAYVGDGVVYTGAGAIINNKYQRIGNIGGNPTKNHFSVACIPRCTAGVFSLLDDATHTPMNVTSVTQPDAFVIRVNYIRTASKINTFVVGPDDALTPYGVVCGGDVGTAFANINTAAPFSAKILLTGGVPSLAMNNLWAGGIAGGNISVSASNASIVRITHTPSVTNDPPVCSYNSATVPGLYPVISFFNDSTVDVMMVGDAAGFVEYNGSAWVQSLSENLTAPSMTWTVGNRLRIDHGITGSANQVPLVAGHKGVYLPQVYDVGTTWFEVEFFDYAGAKVTTQNTDMKIWYRREMPVPCVWADTMDVVVRRGLLKVPSALYSGVAGNNFWVYGDMEI
jgi:hypothetical protein